MIETTQAQASSAVQAPRFVVITGAAGGIGQAMVHEFAANGYTVIATDRVAAPGGLDAHHYLQVDLARTVKEEEYACDVFCQIKDWVGNNGLTTLINNAAVQILGGADSLSRSDWRNTLNVNVVAPFIWIQSLLPELERAKGSVVNISSIHAKLTKRNFVAYATSKAALSGMTRALAVDLGSRVRINAIEPAAIGTPMLLDGFGSNLSAIEELERLHPVCSIGSPHQLAKLAFSIASENFGFLSGATISIDGAIGSVLNDVESRDFHRFVK